MKFLPIQPAIFFEMVEILNIFLKQGLDIGFTYCNETTRIMPEAQEPRSEGKKNSCIRLKPSMIP